MPAVPPPTIDDLLRILANATLTATPVDSHYSTSPQMILNLGFSRSSLGESAVYVFENPSLILQQLSELLKQLLDAKVDMSLEGAYRDRTVKSIEDCIAFMQQELRQDTASLGTLYTKMRRDHLTDAICYLRELDRRRRDIDERQAKAAQREAAERVRKAADEEIKRREREEEERDRKDREGQEAKRRKWAREEEEERKRRSSKTSDSGYARGSKEEAMWNAFRAAGGFEGFTARKDFKDAFEQTFGYGNYKDQYDEFKRSTPPPSSPGKRKWFEVLGVKPGASRDEIRKAARAKTGALHPDKPGNRTPDKLAELQAVNEAKAEGLGGI
jgi:hypothetical protein